MNYKGLKIYLVFVLFPIIVTAQKRNTLTNLICRDHQMLDIIFDDNIFLDLSSVDTCHCFFDIISIDSFSHTYKRIGDKRIEYSNLYKVGIKLNKRNILNLPIAVQNKMFNDTLYYIILSTRLGMYRLFGFYDTDINIFINDVGQVGLSTLSKDLVYYKILSNEESKYFVKSISKELSTFSIKLNKPCNVLKYYFQGRYMYKASSIILPIEPLMRLKL
jgi:hypothetical protein